MATAFTSAHGHATLTGLTLRTTPKLESAKRGRLAAFVHDFLEDLRQKPLQSAALAKHDMFREHILAMSISYFALIVLLVAISLPILAYFVKY